jgi:hypothetical protein
MWYYAKERTVYFAFWLPEPLSRQPGVLSVARKGAYMLKTKFKFSPTFALGLLLTLILVTQTVFASTQQQAATPTPAVQQITPAPTPTPEPEPAIKVIIQETYIQERMEEELDDDPVFSDPVIDLRAPNLALISVTTRVNTFITLRPTATVQFVIEDQEILVEIMRLDVSGFNVPRSFVERQINELREEIQIELNKLTEALTDADLTLTDISATEDTLVLHLEHFVEADEESE